MTTDNTTTTTTSPPDDEPIVSPDPPCGGDCGVREGINDPAYVTTPAERDGRYERPDWCDDPDIACWCDIDTGQCFGLIPPPTLPAPRTVEGVATPTTTTISGDVTTTTISVDEGPVATVEVPAERVLPATGPEGVEPSSVAAIALVFIFVGAAMWGIRALGNLDARRRNRKENKQ